MPFEQELKLKLEQAFLPSFVSVENESHLHSSKRGENSHFKIVIVSDQFSGIRPVARHQRVYQLFQNELSTVIHALTLHIYTQEEWDKQDHKVPKSTKCISISK